MNGNVQAQLAGEEIVRLEREALDRWGRGDPGGFLDLYGDDITYFDPMTVARIDGHRAMTDYYRPFVGQIHIDRFEMLNRHVVVDGEMAVLTYNLVNYIAGAGGGETEGSRWNSTVVYQRRGGVWKTIHSHWSFTNHPAFQTMTPEGTEGLGG